MHETWYRLADRIGGAEGPYIGHDGAFLGPGIPLFTKNQRQEWVVRPLEQLRSILLLAYGNVVALENCIGFLRVSAEALTGGDDAISKIAMLRARLPAISASGAELLARFFDPSKHPRWPKGDPEHHGGEFRPISDDSEEDASVPMLPGRRPGRQRGQIEPARILPDVAPIDVPPVEVTTPDASTAETDMSPEPGSAEADEASLLPSDREQRQAARALLNAFRAENPELFRNSPAEAQHRFESQNNIPEAIRRLPEYQSYWRLPTSYEDARVSDRFREFPDMRAFKVEFGDAPSGWQYHHIVNQNPANEANPDIAPLLHTTDNVVLIPTWWHYVISGIYSTKDKNLGITIRCWQTKLSYSEQLKWGIEQLWR